MVAVIGAWLGYYLITPLPSIDPQTFRATVMLHAVTGLAFLPYLASLVIGRRLPGGSVLDAPLVALLGVLLLTTALSLNWRVSLEFALLSLMALGTFYVLSDGRLFRAWQVETALVLAALAAAIKALWVVGGDYADWLRLTDAVRGGLSFGDLLPPTVPRVHGVGDHPNILGAVLAMSVPFLFVTLFRPVNVALRLLAALGAVAVLLAIFLTLARSAWLGAGAGTLTTALLLAVATPAAREALRRLWPKTTVRRWLVGSAAVAALVVAALGVVYLAQSVETRPLWLFRASDTPRWDVMQAGGAMFRDYPLLGTGPGVYGLLYPEYSGRFPDHAFHAHNGFLQTAIDMGVPGVLAMLALIGALGVLLVQGLRATQGGARLSIAACAGALVAFATFSLFDAPNGSKGPLAALAAVAAVAVLSAREGSARPGAPRFALPWARLASTGALAARAIVPVAMMGLLITWVVRLDVAHSHYSVALGEANAQNWSEALEEGQRAVDIDPEFAIYRLQLGLVQGQAYLATGDRTLLEDAVGQLERALVFEPRSAIAHANLALLLATTGERQGVREHALSAREFANSDPTVVLAAGIALEESGWGEEAIAAYAHALARDADLADSPFWSRTAFRRTSFAEILSSSTVVFNPCLLSTLAAKGLPAGPLTPDEALAACRAHVEARPNDSHAQVSLAEVLIEDGKLDEAFSHIDYVLARQPDFGPGRTALGRWHDERGRLEEARREWLRAGQLGELEALVLLGDTYPRDETPPEVVAALRSELRRAETDRYLTGILYYRLKFLRAPPAALFPPDDLLPLTWRQGVPGRIARAQAALDRWTGAASP